MKLLVIKSILDQRDRMKVQMIIKRYLDPIDFDNWIVINEREIDYFLVKISEKKFLMIESSLSEIGVLIKSSYLSLDDILDKVNINGLSSLMSYEKKYLDEYKRLF